MFSILKSKQPAFKKLELWDGYEVESVVELGTPVRYNDWSKIIAEANDSLPMTGSGKRVGEIRFNGTYTCDSMVSIDSHVLLKGNWRVRRRHGYSCGLAASDKFQGSHLLWFETTQEGKNYSTFGAALEDLYFFGNKRVDEAVVRFQGSQQGSAVNRVYINNFGNKKGIQFIGDFYQIHNLQVRASETVQDLEGPEGSIGIDLTEARSVNLQFYNTTIHSTNYGVIWGDTWNLYFENLDTEHTPIPFVQTYNAINTTLSRVNFQHNHRIGEIRTARWGKGGNDIYINGLSQASVLSLPDGNFVSITNDGLRKDFKVEDYL